MTDASNLLLAVASSDSKVNDLISSMEDASVRADFAKELDSADGKVFEECSSDGGYTRVASVLTNALVLEGKSESAEHVDSLAAALCRLIAGSSSSKADLMEFADKELSQLLGASQDAADTVTEAFLSTARQVVKDSNSGWYAPALVLARSSHLAVPPDQDSDPEFRRDLVDLLGRRVFSNANPATPDQVALCAPLIRDLTKEEFDGSIVRPLKFNIASAPGPNMATLAAFIHELLPAEKGSYLRSYLAGVGNLVPSALKQLLEDDSAYSNDAIAVMVAIVRACPNEGAQIVAKALASALQQDPVPPIYDCLEEVGSAMLEFKGTPNASKYSSLAEKDVLPILQQTNQEDATAALSVWTELQQSSAAAAAPPQAVVPGAHAATSADAAARSNKAGYAPGAQAVSKNDATRLDERIAAKQAGATPSTAVASNNNEETQHRANRENAKAAAFAMAGGAAAGAGVAAVANNNNGTTTSAQDANAKAQARGGATAPATVPGVQAVKKNDLSSLDNRIQQKTNTHSTAAPPIDKVVEDDDAREISESKKMIFVASHQEASSKNDGLTKNAVQDSSSPTVTKEQDYQGLENDQNNQNRGSFNESFQDESPVGKHENQRYDDGSVTRQQPDQGAPVDNIDRGVAVGPDVEYGDSGIGEGTDIAVAQQVDPDEDDEYLPAAVEYDPDSKQPPIYKNRRIRNIGIAVICVIVAVAVGLAVGLTQALKKDEVKVKKTEPPTISPSAAPTTLRDTSAIADFLGTKSHSTVNDEGVTEFNLTAIQNKAREWILNEDEARLTVEKDGEARVLQRWALVVFAYATNSERWHLCGTATGKNGTCIADELDQKTGQWTENTYFAWLSKHHECKWYGVICNENLEVNVIFLENNGLTGQFPKDLDRLEELQSLNLAGNKLTGKLPPEIGNLKKMLDMKLTVNRFTGELPEELYNLNGLNTLVIGGNKFEGQLSPKIAKMEGLKGLHIFDTKMNGTIPSEIGQLEFMNFIRLHGNDFTGTIPSEITKLSSLKDLRIYNSLFSGTLPENIGDMVDLEELHINESRLSGPLPQSFYQLSNLKFFMAWDINNPNPPATRGLNGTISPDIKNMKKLLWFIARGNDFEGELPDEFGELENLQLVWLHHNFRLKGTSPFCNKQKPEIFRQNYGSIEMDCLPTFVNETFTIPQLIDCPCCTICCDLDRVCRELN